MSWDLAVNRKSVGVQIGTNLGFYNVLATAGKKVGPSAWPSQKGQSRRPRASQGTVGHLSEQQSEAGHRCLYQSPGLRPEASVVS